MFEAVESVQALCTKWGGHALAAGMTVAADQLEAFDLQINQYAQTQYPQMPEKCYAIDHQLTLGELTVEQIRMLDRLEPYGSSNPEPIFLLRRAVLAQIAPLSGGKHLRLGFQLQDGTLQALYFGVSPDRFHYRPGAALDLLVHLSINHWNGNDSVSVQIVDLRPTQLEQDKFFRAKQAYERIMRKEPVGAAAARQAVPSREEFAAVYRLLRKMGRFTGSAETLYCLLSNQINFCKLSIILEVLQEKGLVQSDGSGDEIVVCAQPPRVDILDAPLLHSLQQEIGE